MLRRATGAGPGSVGVVAVPPRYDIGVACSGVGKVILRIDGRDDWATSCGPGADRFSSFARRPPGRTTVDIAIHAASGVRWTVEVWTAS